MGRFYPPASVGGSGGATTLDGLTDVTISSPATNEVLTYNGSAWVNQASAAGGANFAEIDIDFGASGDAYVEVAITPSWADANTKYALVGWSSTGSKSPEEAILEEISVTFKDITSSGATLCAYAPYNTTGTHRAQISGTTAVFTP